MTYIFALLVIALVAKDTLPLGDSYVLRGISEGPALMAGLYWLASRGDAEMIKRYALVFAYLAVLLLTSVEAREPIYIVVQTSTLIATILFFIAYIESQREEPDKNRLPLKMTIVVFAVVCLISLVLAHYHPQWVYESTREGNRFNGLFGKSSMMGAASGILFGLAAFGRWSWTVRISAAMVSLPCLYLTGSRTFWVAAIAGLAVTAVLYLKHRWAWIVAAIISVVLFPLLLTAFDFQISSKEQSQILRTRSMTNMSGRMTIWNIAFAKFWERPILGYGFTVGSDAFGGDAQSAEVMKALGTGVRRERSFTPTLHNGFVQALLDSGAVGAFLYIVIIGYALWALYRRDTERKFGAEMYALIFLTVSNLGETVIFSAATYSAVLYWYVAIFGLSLKRPEQRVMTYAKI